jgi:hypothetical protein
MKFYINILLLLICFLSNAQTHVAPVIPVVDSTFTSKLTGDLFYENTYVLGEQYFNQDWADGDILLSNGLLVSNKVIKYNGLIDELIWLNSSNFGKFKVDKSAVSEFWLKNISDHDIHFKRINVSDTSTIHLSNIYAEVKAEGKYSLYIYHRVKVTGSEVVKLEKGSYSFDILTNAPICYIKTPSGHYLKITKLRRTKLLQLFPESKVTIAKMIKSNHLKIRSESDLVKLIELMNK